MRNVLNVLLFTVVVVGITSCGSNSNWELTGVEGRRPWFHPQPYGTVYIPTGTYHSGQSDQDIFRSYIAPNKQVSIHSMWMDETEITNNEYRQFVYYVIDSIAAKKLEYIKEIENPEEMYEVIDYDEEIDYEESAEDLSDMYYSVKQRYNHRREFDIRRLEYEYQWIDYQAAASSKDYYNERFDRSVFIKKKKVKIYPDTLVWIRDFAYSYNDPMVRVYFYHPKYDDYPVVGVNWHQANAFCDWRTRIMQHHWDEEEMPLTEYWRLPTEFEWNMLRVVVVTTTCIHGVVLTPETVRVVSWQTSNQTEEIIWTTVACILYEQILTSPTTTACITWLETWRNGRRIHMLSPPCSFHTT